MVNLYDLVTERDHNEHRATGKRRDDHADVDEHHDGMIVFRYTRRRLRYGCRSSVHHVAQG